MLYFLGLFLMVFGLFQLVFFEFSVGMKREFKPWWRDDRDAKRDLQLANTLRVTTYLAAIVFVELGVYLADLEAVPWSWRLVFYLVVGAYLLWRRCRRQAS